MPTINKETTSTILLGVLLWLVAILCLVLVVVHAGTTPVAPWFALFYTVVGAGFALAGTLALFPAADDADDDAQRCPTCHGTGDGRRDPIEGTLSCPHCFGSGRLMKGDR